MQVGERIKKRRLELGLTQEELAKKMGYSGKSSVCKAETWGDEITTAKVHKFAKALDCSYEYLMGWENDMFYKEPPIETLIEHFKPEEKSKLLTIAAFMKEHPEEFDSFMKLIDVMNKKER